MAVLKFISKPYVMKNTFTTDIGSTVERGMYYLCVGVDNKFALEIIKGAELVKPLYDKRHYRVIGIACGKAEAFELVRRVTQDFVSSHDGLGSFSDYLRDDPRICGFVDITD